MYVPPFYLCLTALLLLPLTTVQAVEGLSLKQAEKIAIQRDAVIKSFRQQAIAFTEQSKAANTWPDPKIKIGAQAVPIDSFDLQQEAMTQVIVGYQQMLPRGDSNELAEQSAQAMSRMQSARANMREREVLMMLRQAWFEVVLQYQSIEIIQSSKQLFEEMRDISESFYASGRQQQQDVVQAQLEISLVEDRLEQANSKLLEARTKLAKWVGDENLPNKIDVARVHLQLVDFSNSQSIKIEIENNPEFTVLSEKIMSQQKQLKIADEQYAPQWGFDINYGKRSGENPDGSERSDLFTAMVTLDLPIFTGNKQDRLVNAEKQRLQAARYDQIEVKRKLLQRLDEVIARLEKLKSRHQLYTDKVLPQARQNSEVSLSGYQSGVVSFFTLTRARIAELNTQLSDLQITIAYNKAYAELQYLSGERL